MNCGSAHPIFLENIPECGYEMYQNVHICMQKQKKILFIFLCGSRHGLIVQFSCRVHKPAGLPVVCVNLHSDSIMLTYCLWLHFPPERKLIRFCASHDQQSQTLSLFLSICVCVVCASDTVPVYSTDGGGKSGIDM